MPIKKSLARFASAFLAFWLRVSPWQALVEAWLITFVILLAANNISRELNNYTLSNIVFFTSCLAGLWLALRARMAYGKYWRRIFLEETVTGEALGALLLAGVLFPLSLFNRMEIFTRSNVGTAISAIFLASSGLAFFAFRGTLWLISYWNRLRRRSLMWSLTNAHLGVMIFAALFAAIFFTIYILTNDTAPDIYRQMPPAMRFLSRMISTVLPALSMYVVATGIALSLLLPPSAIFSFFFSRLLTQRLQGLIHASQRFRSGDYAVRVPIQGEDEIAQLQADFNSMAETLQSTLQELSSTLHNLREEQSRVKELLRSRRELIASVSHELRTPVATMRGYLDATLDNPAHMQDQALQADLEIMRREAARLQKLIDDLFTLSRAEVRGLQLDMHPVELNGLINERVAALAGLAWQSGRVEVIADVAPDLPPALADPTRLEQVLVNLLRNAVRHTPPGGIVAVIAALEENRLRIDVRDTGPGIAPEELPHIWERFYRGKATEIDPATGAGLGLALVKELTEAMGGSVGVESQPGQGCCFTIFLQRAP
jgi:signal transduction histidine kinase